MGNAESNQTKTQLILENFSKQNKWQQANHGLLKVKPEKVLKNPEVEHCGC